MSEHRERVASAPPYAADRADPALDLRFGHSRRFRKAPARLALVLTVASLILVIGVVTGVLPLFAAAGAAVAVAAALAARALLAGRR